MKIKKDIYFSFCEKKDIRKRDAMNITEKLERKKFILEKYKSETFPLNWEFPLQMCF